MDKNKKLAVIAIDGPAGSGKSTTARLIAKKLGFSYLDTGAMYRALTLKILESGLNVDDKSEIVRLMKDTEIQLFEIDGRLNILLDNKNVTTEVRSQRVTNHVAEVAALPVVRQWLLKKQRQIGEKGHVVAEGRDIGTVVFKDALLKIFLVASLTERARRRLRDFEGNDVDVRLAQIVDDLKRRDTVDEKRAASPLKKAPDAIELDTTNLTIKQQVDFIIAEWHKKKNQIKNG